MKHFFTEKTNCLIVFIDAFNMKTICQIADVIESKHPESVTEVTYNFKAKQGSIILKKDSIEFLDDIKDIIDP